ncbi:MAG: hypothetical protein HQK75_08590 [Candidatus Magnetomorum sp.]|nr:hypothetical protein [Candidatus Magnetomorum sp.]
MLSVIEKKFLKLSKCVDPEKKAKLGQFFTPINIAQFMANLFTRTTHVNCHLLDAGAGLGTLSIAFGEPVLLLIFDLKNIYAKTMKLVQFLYYIPDILTIKN